MKLLKWFIRRLQKLNKKHPQSLASPQRQIHNLEALKTIIERNENAETVDQFLSNVGAEYDEYLSIRQAEVLATHKKTNHGLRETLHGWYQQLELGPRTNDPLVFNFLDTVYDDGKITKSQLRVIRRFKVIKRNRHNMLEVVMPTLSDAIISALCLLALMIIVACICYSIIQGESVKPSEILFYYPLGALIGYGIRLSYDYYWARLKISEHLVNQFFLSKSS